MTTAYVDPQSVHNPSAGGKPPATWGDTVRDDIVSLASPPSCKATRTSSQSIANSTWDDVDLTSEDWDTDAIHDNVTNPHRLTAPFSGRYWVAGFARFDSNSTGNRVLALSVNGTEVHTITVSAAVERNVTIFNELELTAADYVSFAVYQNSGGALNMATAWGLIRLVSW